MNRRKEDRRAPSKPQGTLIIIGGREDKVGERRILREVARHITNGRLVLATIASHNREGYLERYQASFGELGVHEVTELYIDDREEARHPDKLRCLDDVHAIFFSGGDQLRITSQIAGTPVYDRICEIYQNGGVIAGTSAGASAMSETMLVQGPDISVFHFGDVHMAPGLSLLPGVIIDQHFAERGRLGRLLGAVSQNPRALGIGIDEDTAIVVKGNLFKVIGSGAVYLVDASDVTYSDVSEERLSETPSICDLKLHVLGEGQTFDLESRRPAAGSLAGFDIG
ncbi:MAG TPA: cyanophycinase [Gemmatimonadales bacterium]|nr:cyanophycinase [Gemmatimonadales bacterium]